jgi:hypothetical protein
MTVLEEEVQERTVAPMRRFVVRRPTAPNGGDPSTGLRREADRVVEPDLAEPPDAPDIDAETPSPTVPIPPDRG